MSKRLFLVFSFLALFFWAQPSVAGEHAYDDDTSPLVVLEIMELLHDHHLDKPSLKSLMDGAIYGIIDSLSDPYTEYFTGGEIKNFTDALDGDLVGVGIELQAGEQYPFIVRVIPDTPAARAGIMAGDLLIAVDGESVKNKFLDDVVTKIRGEQSTQVVLTVKRGDKEIDVALQRTDIHVPTVESEMLADATGYLKINSFGSHTLAEFDDAMGYLNTFPVKSLIIDLRDNGGGYIQEAVNIVERFLPKGSLVTTILDVRGQKEKIFTGQDPVITGLPIVVLVNEATASASEIMAAALKDHGLAQLVGTTTFGKGAAQSIVPLGDGGMLKLTTAKYLTPAGHDIDTVGLRVDHFVVTRALQKEVAWQMLHPDQPLVLTINVQTGQALLNDKSINQDIKVINRGNKMYLPLRPVLESMLYQVHWQDNEILILTGQKPKLVIGGGGSLPLSIIILEKGFSYIPVELLNLLHIDVSSESNKIILTKR